ncbi:MAG: hypothetical protein ACI964_001807 [Spirosomataceae bacterium]|jgi:hypothetical protein
MKQFYLSLLLLCFSVQGFAVTPITSAVQSGTSSGIMVTWGETNVNLSSPDVSLNRYQLSYNEVGQSPVLIDNISNALRTYTITGLSCGKSYEVKVIEVIRVTLPSSPFTPPFLDIFTPSSPRTVTVTDSTPPVIHTKDATVFLDMNGQITISLPDVAVGFSDDCGTVSNVAIDRTSFGCGDLGEQYVVLTVTDNAGNVATKTAKVTVKDAIAPGIFLQNQTYQLVENGYATLREETIRNATADNCGVTEVSANKMTFDKNDIGTNEVLVTVKDASGNVATKTILVTIVDAMPPMARVKDAVIYLNNSGTATLKIADVNDGSADNVGVTELILSKTDFDCSDLGDNVVSLYVRDGSGNLSVATPKVTVVDNLPPTVNVKPMVLPLDASGKAVLTVPMIEELIADNCTITEVRFSKSEFSRTDMGEQEIKIYVTDAGGNQTVADVMLTVVDVTAPEVSVQNITLFANESCIAELTAGEVNAEIVEAVGLDSTYLSQTTFMCDGDTTKYMVTFTAVDKSMNIGVDTFTVTVCDTLSNQPLNAAANGKGKLGTEVKLEFAQKSGAEIALTEEVNYEFYTFGPNPTGGELNVYFRNALPEVPALKLSTMSGREVILREPARLINDRTLRLNLRNLNAGTYLLSVRQGLQSKTVKVVIY